MLTRTLQDRVFWGIWLMVFGQLLHFTGGVFEKMLLSLYPVPQMTFIRSLFRLLPLCIILLKQSDIRGILRIEQPLSHILRIAAYVSYNYIMLYAISVASLTKSCSIQYATPFFTILFSAWILKEKIGRHKWIAIAAASLGVIIAMQPFAGFETIFLVILFGSAIGSLNKILIRKLVATEHSLTLTLFGNLALAIVLIPLLFVYWHPVSWPDLGLFAISSLLTATGQYATVQSLRFAEASTLAPFDYTSILWATGFDFIIWGVVPTGYLTIGTVIIILSNLWLLKSFAAKQNKLAL